MFALRFRLRRPLYGTLLYVQELCGDAVMVLRRGAIAFRWRPADDDDYDDDAKVRRQAYYLTTYTLPCSSVKISTLGTTFNEANCGGMCVGVCVPLKCSPRLCDQPLAVWCALINELINSDGWIRSDGVSAVGFMWECIRRLYTQITRIVRVCGGDLVSLWR